MLSQVLDENARKPLYISFLAFSLCSDMMVLAASVCASAVFLLQGQPDQSICLISHEQRNVQHVIIQFQIIQGEADPQLDLVRKQFFEFFEALNPPPSLPSCEPACSPFRARYFRRFPPSGPPLAGCAAPCGVFRWSVSLFYSIENTKSTKYFQMKKNSV